MLKWLKEEIIIHQAMRTTKDGWFEANGGCLNVSCVTFGLFSRGTSLFCMDPLW